MDKDSKISPSEKKPPDRAKSPKDPKAKKERKKHISKVLVRSKKGLKMLGKDKVVKVKVVNFFKKLNKSDSAEVTVKNSLDNIKKFLGCRSLLDTWKANPKKASKDKKQITEMAKKVLTKDEFDSLEEVKIEHGLKNRYTAAIAILDTRFEELQKALNREELKKEDLNMTQQEFDKAMAIFEKEIKAREEEKDDEDEEYEIEDPDIKKHQQDIKDLEEVWGMPIEKIQEACKLEGLDIDAMDIEDSREEEDEGDKIVDDPKIIESLDKFIDEVDEKEIIEEVAPEINEQIKKIKNGEIELKASKENKINNLRVVIKRRQDAAKEVVDEKLKLQNYKGDIGDVNAASVDQLKSLLKDHKNLNLENSVNNILLYLNSQKLSKTEAVLAVSVKLLLRELSSVKSLTDKLINVLEARDLEKQEAKKFEKKPGIIRKIESGNYLPDEEMKKLTKVNKALRNIKDFVQMPKWNDWKSFSEEEKNLFMKERMKWNLARLKFLINRAKGVEDEEDKKLGFSIQDHEIAKALHCNVYYLDKFESGFKIKKEEWEKFYKGATTLEDRKKLVALRVEAKSILEKLADEKKLTGLLKVKGQWIETRGQVFWKLKLNEIFKKKIDEMRRAQPWRFPGPPRFPMEGSRGKKKTFLGKKKKADKRSKSKEDEERNFI